MKTEKPPVRKLDVCLTPELLHLYDLEERIVVVLDVLRATSTMTVALAHGAEKIIPVASVEECHRYKKLGFPVAAEYLGKTIEGFEYGNSPFEFMSEKIKGKTLIIKTTNGTEAIHRCKTATMVLIGSFLNMKSIVKFLRTEENDVLLFCAGWKGKFNLEDTLCAGAITSELLYDYIIENDSTLAAYHLYNLAKNDMKEFLKNSSHFRRLGNLDIEKDVEFCLRKNLYNVIPVLEKDYLIDLNKIPELESLLKGVN